MEEPILQVEDLRVEFLTPEGRVQAVNGVSFSVSSGRTLVLTGESGCGKSTMALAALDLVPHPGRITSGRILLRTRDILTLPAEELRRLRGREIAIVFQDPATGLNPVLTIGKQVEEIFTNHLDVPRKEARARTLEALEHMGLAEAEEIARSHPFQLSGGMAQRVAIAIATALNPAVLILDEPTSALDVTVQAGILDDLRRLQAQHGTAIVLITHDLGVVAQMADEVAVVYAGQIVEQAGVRELFQSPRHPYTALLLASRPRWDRDSGPLASIKGAPPSLIDMPDQCPFLPRCSKAVTACRNEPSPPLAPLGKNGHLAACYNPMYGGE